MPSAGMSQNAVANVPAILPAVEIANRRPAVRPSRSSERARSRTAIGVTLPRITLGAPKRRIVATSGSARGPGSQLTTRSSAQPSMYGIASTSSEAETSAPSSSRGAG